MFTVDHQANRIKAVKTKTFSELGFTERKCYLFIVDLQTAMQGGECD